MNRSLLVPAEDLPELSTPSWPPPLSPLAEPPPLSAVLAPAEAPGLPPGALVERGRHALEVLGSLTLAREWFDRAFRAAEQDGDREVLAEAALGLSGIWVCEYRTAGQRTQVLARQRHALALLPADSQLALRLRIRLAAEADYPAGRHDRVLLTLQEARERGDAVTLATALSLSHHCLLGPEHAVLRASLAEELLHTAYRSRRRIDWLTGLLWRTVDLFLDGDPYAERSLAELSGALREQEHLAIGFAARAMRVMLTIRSGDFERAERLALACAESGQACGDVDTGPWLNAQLVAIRWFQGRIGELLPALRQEAGSPLSNALDGSPFSALAIAAAAVGDRRAAAGALARLGRGDLTRLPTSSTWLATLYGVAEAAALLDDTTTAETAYRLLRPHAGLPMMASLAVGCFGSTEHALGVAALAADEPARAVTHLRAAVRQNLALSHWPAACLSRHRLGQALLRDAGPAEGQTAAHAAAHATAHAAAHAELAAAAQEAAELGMSLPPESHSGNQSAGCPVSHPVPLRSVPRQVQVRLLGPVDLAVDGVPQPVSGLRRKAVLAVLGLKAGALVSTDELIYLVWGDRAPATATNTVQSHISHLRRLFGSRDAVLARAPGYQLNRDVGVPDAVAAERLIRAGLAAGSPQTRAEHLQEAIGLWRDRALLDVLGVPWLEEQANGLSVLLLNAREALAEARLALGQHALLLGDLRVLVRENTLHEHLHGHLMLALYRSGQQGAALAVYRQLRAALRTELGIDPSQPLRDLEAAILRQDAELNDPQPLRPR